MRALFESRVIKMLNAMALYIESNGRNDVCGRNSWSFYMINFLCPVLFITQRSRPIAITLRLSARGSMNAFVELKSE